ncbi:MAG: hypothetical protein ACLRM8_02075 [Alistipes sp.]
MKSTLVNMTAVLRHHPRRFGRGGRREHDHGGTDRSGRAGGQTAALNGVLPAFDETAAETLTIDEMPITVYTATEAASWPDMPWSR